MSANLNVTNARKKKRILMVVANPSVSPTTGWPVGFWWAEVTHPVWAFTEASYEVEIRSPEGCDVREVRCQRQMQAPLVFNRVKIRSAPGGLC